MVYVNDAQVKKILAESKVIAVAGCSRDPEKEAYKVPAYLQAHGYRIIPVNPFADEILGEKATKSLGEIKGPVDLVDVFRPSTDCLAVAQDALKMAQKPKVFWMQLGIRNAEARKLLEANGIAVVEDRCTKAEHQRLAQSIP